MKRNFAKLAAQLKKQKDTALGLDIGKDSVKLVELKREGEVIKLSKIDSASIAHASEVQLQQSQVIQRIITNLFAKNKIKNKEIILGINGQSVFIKFLEILPVGTEKLEQTIRYEAKQQIPFSLEEVEWDAHLFGVQWENESSAHRVLLVAIKKDRLASKKALVEKVKLRTSILDVSTLSIYNCIKFNQDYDESNLTAVLDIGAQSTDLLILKGDNFWMRSFAIGGDNLTVALEKRFNIGFAEAEKLKQKMSMDSPDIKEAISPVLEDLQGEIARSIEYYCFQQKQAPPEAEPLTSETKPLTGPAREDFSNGTGQGKSEETISPTRGEASNGAGQIDQILLSGGTSQMPGLDKFLAEKFSCEVRLVAPFKMLQIDEQMKLKLNSQKKVLFSQAVGLALRGLSRSYININLLKEQIKARMLAYQRLTFGVGSVFLALVILFGASTFMRQDYREKGFRLQHLKGLLNTFSSYQPKIEQLQRKEKLLSRQTGVLHSVALNRALWLEVLSQLQKMLPDDLWVTEFVGTISFNVSLEGNFASKLDLQGKAVSYEGVNNFVTRLKSSPLFTEVKPLSSAFIEEQAPLNKESHLSGQTEAKEKIEVIKFSISMKVLPIATDE